MNESQFHEGMKLKWYAHYSLVITVTRNNGISCTSGKKFDGKEEHDIAGTGGGNGKCA